MDPASQFSKIDLDEAVRHGGQIWQEFASARIFVTGGSGFLGRWMLAVLLHADRVAKLGLSVTCLTRDADRFCRDCPNLTGHPALTLIEGDVRDFSYPDGQFTHVIHGATDTSMAADQNRLELMDTIVGGTRRSLDLAKAAGVGKFLLMSSGAVYGPQPADLDQISESYPGACPSDDPRSTYGQSKRLAEQLCSIYGETTGMATKVARCFAFVGPQMRIREHFAIGNFIGDAVAGRPVRIKGDGTPLRSYLYSADAAVWLLTILAIGKAGKIYNVGSDAAISLAALAERVAALVGRLDGVIPPGVIIEGTADPRTLRNIYVPSIDRARQELGLKVWTSLDEAIVRTARWVAESSGPSPSDQIK